VAAADAQQPLLRFLSAARSAGIRISTAESMDALRVVELVGYGDREAVRDALELVIAKTAEERDRFHDCFNRYFSRYDFRPFEEKSGAVASYTPAQGSLQLPFRSLLGQMLFAGDRAELATVVESAAAAMELFDIRFSSQRALYARRLMDHIGLPAFDDEMAQLRSMAALQTGDVLDRMEAARNLLTDEVHAFVDQQFTLLAHGLGEQVRDEALERVRVNTLDSSERERMKLVVRAIAKRLATRYGPTRRRKRRGQLDVRATMRRNLRHGGIPFVTVWRKRKIDKPRVMALCDVSGSVAPVAEFLLLFLHGLHEALSGLRSFAFSSHLIEATEMIGTEMADDAASAVLSKIGFGSSNYGRSLANFEAAGMAAIDNTTTVIILGDGRGNGTDPRTEILQRIFERCRRVIWLNPEPRSAWGTGDSDMDAYARFCTSVSVCNSIRHLEEVVADILNR
jgi:uncharacterized protein with von Willebrand factor type A (vWA) domain